LKTPRCCRSKLAREPGDVVYLSNAFAGRPAPTRVHSKYRAVVGASLLANQATRSASRTPSLASQLLQGSLKTPRCCRSKLAREPGDVVYLSKAFAGKPAPTRVHSKYRAVVGASLLANQAMWSASRTPSLASQLLQGGLENTALLQEQACSRTRRRGLPLERLRWQASSYKGSLKIPRCCRSKLAREPGDVVYLSNAFAGKPAPTGARAGSESCMNKMEYESE
jgi:hypothetical protein